MLKTKAKKVAAKWQNSVDRGKKGARIGLVKVEMAETKVNQEDEPNRGRLSVPALALEYIEEIADRKAMTRGEVVMLAVSKLRAELLAA